jgi:hypothetical protein
MGVTREREERRRDWVERRFEEARDQGDRQG